MLFTCACMYVFFCMYISIIASLSTVVLNSRDRHKKTWHPTFSRLHNMPHNQWRSQRNLMPGPLEYRSCL